MARTKASLPEQLVQIIIPSRNSAEYTRTVWGAVIPPSPPVEQMKRENSSRRNCTNKSRPIKKVRIVEPPLKTNKRGSSAGNATRSPAKTRASRQPARTQGKVKEWEDESILQLKSPSQERIRSMRLVLYLPILFHFNVHNEPDVTLYYTCRIITKTSDCAVSSRHRVHTGVVDTKPLGLLTKGIRVFTHCTDVQLNTGTNMVSARVEEVKWTRGPQDWSRQTQPVTAMAKTSQEDKLYEFIKYVEESILKREQPRSFNYPISLRWLSMFTLVDSLYSRSNSNFTTHFASDLFVHRIRTNPNLSLMRFHYLVFFGVLLAVLAFAAPVPLQDRASTSLAARSDKTKTIVKCTIKYYVGALLPTLRSDSQKGEVEGMMEHAVKQALQSKFQFAEGTGKMPVFKFKRKNGTPSKQSEMEAKIHIKVKEGDGKAEGYKKDGKMTIDTNEMTVTEEPKKK
ncbi:hypothetical protein EV360DRAFT_66423 [Lentinula raphanica]|nr:hypothetical protein EV360DRAFT_66423 [Lentinula raphanica]